MQRQESKKVIRASILMSLVSAIECVIMLVLKDWLIIGFGVRRYELVAKAGGIGVGLSVFWLIIQLIPLVRSNLRRGQKQREETQILTDYAEDNQNPEFTRRRLEKLQQEMPDTQEVVKFCLQQMDLMDSMQQRQETLIRDNNAIYLQDTLAALNAVERRICRNIRNIINLCNAAGSCEHLQMHKIDQFFRDTEEKLSHVRKLLEVSVDWVNHYDEDQYDNRNEIESWIKIIRQSLEEE